MSNDFPAAVSLPSSLPPSLRPRRLLMTTFWALCSLHVRRPKYRLIVFEAEISLGWGRPAGGAREATARKSREEGALDDGVCHDDDDDDDDDRAKL